MKYLGSWENDLNENITTYNKLCKMIFKSQLV